MKFISKNPNYRVILKPGIPSEALTGRPAEPAIALKFEDSVAVVHDEKIIAMAMNPEKGFGIDYISGEKGVEDPFTHVSSEPEHDIMTIEHGGIGKNLNPKTQFSIPPELRKMVAQMVAEGVKEVAPKMAAAMVADMIKEARSSQPEVSTESTEASDLTNEDSMTVTDEQLEVVDESLDVAGALPLPSPIPSPVDRKIIKDKTTVKKIANIKK